MFLLGWCDFLKSVAKSTCFSPCHGIFNIADCPEKLICIKGCFKNGKAAFLRDFSVVESRDGAMGPTQVDF